MKYRRRLACHGDIFCCQYCDSPLCNGTKEPHRVARAFRWAQRKVHGD